MRPARYAVSAEVKVAARRIVFDGCEAMNGSTPAQESHPRASLVGESLGCRSLPNTPVSLRSERCAFAVVGQHIGRMLNGADCVQKGLDGAFDVLGIIGERQHPLADVPDLLDRAYKIATTDAVRPVATAMRAGSSRPEPRRE